MNKQKDKNIGYLVRLLKNSSYGSVCVERRVDKNLEDEVNKLMWKMGFVETVKYGWIRGFTRVFIDENGIYIGHIHIGNKNLRMSKVSNPLKTLTEWIKYFDNL